MSLAKLFYMKETFREHVRQWRQACFRKRMGSSPNTQHPSRFTLEALEPRVLLSASPVSLDPLSATLGEAATPVVHVILGDITDGSVWRAGDIQRITGDARVIQGTTLTIEAGAIIQFDAFSGVDLVIDGTLHAQGSSANPILFTSVRDDTGLDGILGTADDIDTEGNGPTTGFAGEWNSLQFSATSTGNVLDYVEVRYGGGGSLGAAVVDDGAALSLTNSVLRASLTLTGGTLDLSGVVQVDGAFTMSGGTLSGTGTLLLTGADNSWTGGLMTGGGTTTIAAGATLTLGGTYGSLAYLGDRTLRNEGTLVDQGSTYYGYALDFDGAGVLQGAGGTLQFLTSGPWQQVYGAAGTLTLTGDVNVTVGKMHAAGNMVIASGATVSGNGFSLDSGTLAIEGAVTIHGFALTGGTLSGTGTLLLTGADNSWTGGLMTGGGTTTIAAGATLTLGGTYGSLAYLGDRTLRNEGTLVDQGSTYFGYALDLEGSAALQNIGTFETAAQGGWRDTYGALGTLTFINSGLLAKMEGGGDFEFTNTTFTNSGDILVTAGRILINGIALDTVLQPRPNLVVQDLAVTGIDGAVHSGGEIEVTWRTANIGDRDATGTFEEQVIVTNAANEVVASISVPFEPAGAVAIATGSEVVRSARVTLPHGARGAGTLTVTVVTDANREMLERGPTGELDNRTSISIDSILIVYPDLVVSTFAAPSTHRSGDIAHFSWTVNNLGLIATDATAWADRLVLSHDDIIGNGDDLVLATVGHSGSLAGGDSYSAGVDVAIPGLYDGTFYFAVVADTFADITEPDTRTNNTSVSGPVLLTPYHADLVPTFLSVPASATGGDTMSVSWRVTNNGDATTNSTYWHDQLWLSPDGTLGAGAIALGTWGHSGVLAVGQSYDVIQQVLVPNGISGDYQLVLHTDVSNYVFESRFNDNNIVISDTSVAVSPAPPVDLRVQNVTAPVLVQPGQSQTIEWDVTNIGAGLARQPWTDQIFVSSDGTLNGAIYLGSVTHGISLNAGDSYHATVQITVPDLADGTWQFVVLTDAANQVYETGAADAESVNTGVSAVSSVVHPDLRPTDILVSALTGGQAGTVSWNVRNDGTGAAQSSWIENVFLSADGTLDGSDVFLGQVTVTGGLAAGASSTQSLNVTPPLTASGSYQVFVISDAANSVRELAGESNNAASVAATVTQAPLPNLLVSDISAPSSGLAGRSIELSWTVINSGDLVASGSWSDQVYLSGDPAAGGDILLGSFYYSGNILAPSGSVTRTEQVILPGFITGDQWLVVRTDVGNAVFELNDTDNAAVNAGPTNIGAALNLAIVPTSVNETAGASAATATISRAGNTASPLQVFLSQSGSDLVLPASVLIPAGQSSVNVALGVLDNSLVDGNRASTITASAAGFAGGSDSLNIIDNDMATLTMTATPLSIDEAYGPLTITVTRNTDSTEPITVMLTNEKPYKLTVPESVVIAAGATSATFQVTPVNDTVVEGNRTVDITASAPGFAGGGLRLEVIENDIPTLSLDLATSVISEAAGVAATYGTVTRSIVTDTPVAVALSADFARVRLPNFVVIGAGEASADFNITIQDNSLADGDHQVSIFADVLDAFLLKPMQGTRVEKTLLITDNDGPTLTLTVNQNVLAESAGAGAASGTIARNTPTTDDLTVYLSSTDTTEATVPLSVVIPAGQRSVDFAVNAIQDGIQDGTQNVTLIASAPSFNSGSVALQVTDQELPDLQVSNVSLPGTATTGSTIALSWTVSNAGFGSANGTWQDSVYLSSDNLLSADDQLLITTQGSTPLTTGDAYAKTITTNLGTQIGNFWAFVVTDSGSSVTELSESNNIRAAAFTVVPSYAATVSTDVTQAPMGTPILMTGQAVDTLTNAPKPFVPVTVKVTTGGTVRSIDAVTDSLGIFTATFTPLPGEAGHYTIAAVYPGVFGNTPQDSFDLLGMKAVNGITVALLPGQTQTGQIQIKNLSPIALNQVTASIASAPPGVTITFGSPTTLPGSGSVQLGYTVTAAAEATALIGSAPVQIISAEGVTISTTLALSVTPLTPQLVTNPGFLIEGMLRGGQRIVSFEVTNTGGAATGPLQVQLPTDTPWLKLGSTAQMPSLAPGEKTTITLILTPGADLPLQRYDGTINVVGHNSYVTVPFQFRAVSEAVGDVQITVTDEYTYFAADKPNVAKATVQLLDAYTYDVVATAVTDATGIVSFTGIAQGPYMLQVRALQHDTVRTPVQVTPGGLIQQEVFLHRQAVTYSWTVVPTEIQDHYTMVLESTFETDVPMPVVTVDEPYIVPLVVPGYKTQFNITLRNHGLINAENVQILLPEDSDYLITPLISEIPVLAAKSAVTIPVTISIRPDSVLLQAATAADGSLLASDVRGENLCLNGGGDGEGMVSFLRS